MPVKGGSFPLHILSKGTTSKPAIWSSSSSVPTAISSVQTALNVLGNWASTWRLPLKCEASFFSTYTSEASAPLLNLSDTQLFFNPTPKFLGSCFWTDLRSLETSSFHQSKVFPPFEGSSLHCICFMLSHSMHSLSLLYKTFIHPVLTYAAPGWYPFSSKTNQDGVKVLHNTACRVISGYLSYTPISFLQLESYQPPRGLPLHTNPCKVIIFPHWINELGLRTYPFPPISPSLTS